MAVGHYMHREEKIESPAPEWIVGWLYGLQMVHDYALRHGSLIEDLEAGREDNVAEQ